MPRYSVVRKARKPRGVLVLVFGSLTHERRYQLKIECIKRRRKVLVIDELLLLTILSAADSSAADDV